MKGCEITELVLTERHIKAGLKAFEEEHWVMLYNVAGRRFATFSIGTDNESIHNEADRYLKNIDQYE